jgi:PhnB protein
MATTPPQGNQRIIPYLGYRDCPAAIRFLCRAFAFEERFRMDMPDGKVGHAELGYQGNIVMLASAWKEAGQVSPLDLPGVHGFVFCWVDDVDAHFERAWDGGATIVAQPAEQHGARSYRALDLEGHRWIFATQLAEPGGAS